MKKDKTTKSKKRKMETTSKKVSKKLKKDSYSNLARVASKSKLEAFIKRANEAYYNTGKPLMEDSEYDLVIDIMKERYPDSDVLSQIGAPIRSEIEKITLPYWMGSMDKVKPDSKTLISWLMKYEKPYVISQKLDGLSGLLTYNLDKKSDIFLYTRGNGSVGQNISHLIPFLGLNKSKILKKIGNKPITIRGELIMKKAVFEAKYASKYPKARSLISGNINAKKPNIEIIKDIDFVGYELITDGEKNLPASKQFEFIKEVGMECVDFSIVNSELNSDILVKMLVDMKNGSPYEIDGIILTDNKEHKRNMSGNPKYAVAFKSQLNEQIAITTVEYVEYNPSKHGTLIPRIKLKPVVIGGDTITYTTGFNAKYIKDNKIGVGAKLKIIRSGDVIPYIMDVINPSKDGKWQQPDPDIGKWRWNDSGVDIILEDKTTNKQVIIKGLLNFFTTLKIIGVSEGIITRLVENGFNTISKICQMSVGDFLTLPGIKDKMANKLFNNIHSVIDDVIPIEKLMTATNLFKGGLAEKKLVVVVKKYPDLMKRVSSLKVEDIIQCEGFSTKTAKAFLKGLKEFDVFIKEHPFLKYKINKSKKTNIDSTSKMSGQYVVMSGVRDKNMEAEIIKLGGVIQNTVNSKTTLLIAKDVNSSSSKIKKAEELDIKIVSYNSFKI